MDDWKVFSFWVDGDAVPQGSKVLMRPKNSPRTIMLDHNHDRLASWRADVRVVAEQSYPDPPYAGPVTLRLDFYRNRPASHFGRRQGQPYLKDGQPPFPFAGGDVDKLSRAMLDAMTGSVYLDDSQVVNLQARKWFCSEDNPLPGAYVTVGLGVKP